jgi:hypothetical protein
MPPPTKIVCLCPTYCRPWHVSSSVGQWLRQTHPAEERWLLVGDDLDGLGGLTTERLRTAIRGQGYDNAVAERVHFHKFKPQFTLPHKYNAMAEYALAFLCRDADLLVVWEDDDTYLPGHLAQIARAWNTRNRPTTWWGHPELVLSDYTLTLQPEAAHGRFHASLAVTADLWERCPWVETAEGYFDQQYLQSLGQHQPRARYDLRTARGEWYSTPSYVFRWHTGTPHGQAYMPDHGKQWQNAAKQALRAEFTGRRGAWDCMARVDGLSGRHIATATDNGRSPVALPIPVTPGPQ